MMRLQLAKNSQERQKATIEVARYFHENIIEAVTAISGVTPAMMGQPQTSRCEYCDRPNNNRSESCDGCGAPAGSKQ